MAFVFLIGPIILIAWLVVPFVAIPLAFARITGTAGGLLLWHAWLAHISALTAKLVCFYLVDRTMTTMTGRPLVAGDWMQLLQPEFAIFLLTVALLVSAGVETIYCRWAMDRRGPGVFGPLLAWNFAIDAGLAVPVLIFSATAAQGPYI